LKVLAVEPYFGGSHKEFLLAYQRLSGHDVRLLTMSARKWKWRMRGAGLHFAGCRDDFGWADVLLVSDFVNLPELFGLLGERMPSAVYFHENQMTYPVRSESERDYHFGFTNILTAAVADAVVFNSDFHRRDFLRATGKFIAKMPDYRPENLAARIEARSRVVYPGVEIGADLSPGGWGRPPMILFNHRWEFDKCPEEFFAAMDELSRAGLDFRLGVTGESYRERPEIFEEVGEKFAERFVQFGFADAKRYLEVLDMADIVVSTSIQEFFCISVVEAVSHGAWPLLPNRLSYPELIPEEYHKRCLYENRADLVEKLKKLLAAPAPEGREALVMSMKGFSRESTARELDEILAGLKL